MASTPELLRERSRAYRDLYGGAAYVARAMKITNYQLQITNLKWLT